MSEPRILESGIVEVEFGEGVTIINPVNVYKCKIGDGCFVGPFVEIQGKVTIGPRTRIQSHAFICELVTIGSDCFISHGAMFINDLFSKGKPAGGDKSLWGSTKIGNNVSVGTNATILPVTICDNVVIGAGSVVTKDIDEPGIYAGNPARLIRTIQYIFKTINNMKIPFVDLHKQYLGLKNEIDASIADVISNTSFIRGPQVDRFEKLWAEKLGVSHCISCANGTDAIYISMKALGIKPGDEVITTAHSWISTTETITQAGGKVVFCDTDYDTFNIDQSKIEAKITSKTVGIIPVHLYGQSCDMESIMAIAKKNGLWVIEDCAQAHLAKYKNQYVGTFGDMATFSFYPGKNLGAYGDAGGLVTSDSKLADWAATYARHGGKGEHVMEGINSRMDGIQGAVLSVKLPHLESWSEARRKVAKLYSQALAGVGDIVTPLTGDDREHVFHLYVIRTNRRDELRQYLKEKDIPTVLNYPKALPFYPAYSYLNHKPEDFPVAYENQSRILSLPIFPEMEQNQICYVTDMIKAFFSQDILSLTKRQLIQGDSIFYMHTDYIISKSERVLVTGSSGFIGAKVVQILLEYGFESIRCFTRPSSRTDRLDAVIASLKAEDKVEVITGDLLSPADCEAATKDISVVYHLAAGIEKSFAGAFMNSALATRNLVRAFLSKGHNKRFVNISSFAVYSNLEMKRGALLDESCSIEDDPQRRNDAYGFGKIQQDRIVEDYAETEGLKYVLMRPGSVFGPGKKGLTGRIGIDTFGFFIHLGGSNRIPLTYVDNCAEAIVLAGLVKGVESEAFNIVDDNLPSSRAILRAYKKKVGSFFSVPIPYWLMMFISKRWESYSRKSGGQLPPVFNKRRCSAEWKGNRYANEKIKNKLGWKPRIPMSQALDAFGERQ